MKIILVSNTAAYLFHMWLPLARALRDRGSEVVLAAPIDSDADALVAAGFRFEPLPLLRRIGAPWNELRTLASIYQLYRRERPDVVHHFTPKPMVYGSLAARLLHVSVRISTVAGLGYVFAKKGWLASVAQRLALRLYRFALIGRNSWVIIQNPDDRNLLLRHSVVSADRTALVRGSGVDSRAFPLSPLPPGVPVVLCAARLLWDKGIGDFVAAARLLREQHVSARFLLAGWHDSEHPVSIPKTIVEGWHNEGVIEYVGHCSDMASLLKQSTVVVLPTKYREGVPRILVEAASTGRPLVATDVPGCREVCVDGVTGTLIKPGDVSSLAAAIAELLANRSRAEDLGRNGRKVVESAFDLRLVVSETVAVYSAATMALGTSMFRAAVEPST
jgi:glycosyltransferase involved in cell wall biosynthesis